VCAVILGIILVTIIRPGEGHEANMDDNNKVTRDVLTADTLLDLVRYIRVVNSDKRLRNLRQRLVSRPHRNLFPPNIVQATMFQYRTHLLAPENATALTSNGTKFLVSSLDSEQRNVFTISKLKLKVLDEAGGTG
jgi:hypothetical protein